MKPHKYGAKKVIVTDDGTMFEVDQLKQYNITDVAGIPFDSKMEAQYYKVLRDGYISGSIDEIELQPTFVLQEKPKIKYIADFRIKWAGGQEQIIDVKGVQTQAFRLKVRMFIAKYPDKSLVIVTRKGSRWIEKELTA